MYIFEVEIYRHDIYHGTYIVSGKDDVEARKAAIKADNPLGGGMFGEGMEINFCNIKKIYKLANE